MSHRSGRTNASRNTLSGGVASTGASVSSQITSASVLASKVEFKHWVALVGLDREQVIELVIPLNQAFQHLRDVKDQSNRFPNWLTVADSPQFAQIPTGLRTASNRLFSDLSEIKISNPEQFHDGDDLTLSELLAILQACNHTRRLSNRLGKPTEMDGRFVLDSLLNHLCECDEDALLEYSTEQELKLPRAPFGKFDATKTKPDGLLYLEIPDYKPYDLTSHVRTALSAFVPDIPTHLRVVHCVAEFKREASGAKQAIMGIVSGVWQKRVLKVPGQFTFGVFHHEKVFLYLVAGVWQADEKIHLYEIGQYTTLDPVRTLQFYLALQAIQRLAVSYRDQLRASERSLAAHASANPPAAEWSVIRMESVTEHPNEFDGQTPHAGGANAQTETNEQCENRDKVLSYLSRTSDQYGFLPVDLPPTPPIDPPASPIDSTKPGSIDHPNRHR
ncbi:hypothetical protein RSAG8_10857, partial [Rhizoctonia solani AG-8 WAC10335]